jgi:16S rRNA (cytosine1402-N4)-methyltransferase
MQIDDPARGFSYKHDGPLDMRMDARRARTAADFVNKLSVRELSDALRDLGDEPEHERIGQAIGQRRATRPFSRTSELSDAVARAVSSRSDAARSVARTFQALRILVNDEFACLREFLRVAPACLRAGGRIGVISFHSGEDRIVKQAFRRGFEAGVYETLSDGVITVSAQERRSNPRSASAKLRWARRSTPKE